jgi:hypothetical protein
MADKLFTKDPEKYDPIARTYYENKVADAASKDAEKMSDKEFESKWKAKKGSLKGLAPKPKKEETQLDEAAEPVKFKVGDIVIPKIGPHKGQSHTVIHVHDDGRVNVRPMNKRPRDIKYHLGAATAKPNQLTKYNTEETQLDEISKEKLTDYSDKVKSPGGIKALKVFGRGTFTKERAKGLTLANKKITGKAKISATEETVLEAKMLEKIRDSFRKKQKKQEKSAVLDIQPKK